MTLQTLLPELKELIYFHTNGQIGPAFSAVCRQFRNARFRVMRGASIEVVNSIAILPNSQATKNQLSASTTIQEISLIFTNSVLIPLKSISQSEKKNACEQLFTVLVSGSHVELLKLACRHLQDEPTLQPLIYSALLLVEQPDAAEHYCPNLMNTLLIRIQAVKHLILKGRLTAAYELLKPLSWASDEKIEALQNLVIALANRDRLDEAFSLFCDMRKNTHRTDDAGIALIKKYLEIMRPDKAFECWEKLWFREKDPTLLSTLLFALLNSNMLDKAKAFTGGLAQYLQENFCDCILSYLIETKQWDEAFAFVDPQKYDFDSSYIVSKVITELVKADRIDQALTLFRSMTSWKETVAEPLVVKLIELNRFDDAASCIPYLSLEPRLVNEITLPFFTSLLARKRFQNVRTCLLAHPEKARISLASKLFCTIEQRHIVPLYDIVPEVAEKIDSVAIRRLIEKLACRRLSAAEILFQRYNFSNYICPILHDDIRHSLIQARVKRGEFKKATNLISEIKEPSQRERAVAALISALITRKKFDLAIASAEKEPSHSSFFPSIVAGLIKNKSTNKLLKLLPKLTFSASFRKEMFLNDLGKLFVEEHKWQAALDCLEEFTTTQSYYYSSLREQLVRQVIESNSLEEFRICLLQFAGCGSDIATYTASQLTDKMDFTAASSFVELCKDPGMRRRLKLHILKQRAASFLPPCTIV